MLALEEHRADLPSERAWRELFAHGDGLCRLLKGAYSEGIALLKFDAVRDAVQYA